MVDSGGTVTVGAYNSATAASGNISLDPQANDTTVAVGDLLRLVLRVERKGQTNNPETWLLTGNLPAGASTVTNFDAGTFSITGRPTESGFFSLLVQSWGKPNMTGTKAPDFNFTITVEGTGPVFTQQPGNKGIPWGGNLNLSATVDIVDGTTYQWQRILSGEADYSDIVGATGNTFPLDQLTSADEGMYKVVATNGSSVVQSDPALVTVNASAFQLWQESQFVDPFGETSGMDRIRIRILRLMHSSLFLISIPTKLKARH
jgi:hypothetical protein